MPPLDDLKKLIDELEYFYANVKRGMSSRPFGVGLERFREDLPMAVPDAVILRRATEFFEDVEKCRYVLQQNLEMRARRPSDNSPIDRLLEAIHSTMKQCAIDKQARREKNEAKLQIAVKATQLVAAGATIESIAQDLRVRPSELAKLVGKFREHGFLGFYRRRNAPRSPLRTPAAIREALRRERIVTEAFRIMGTGITRNRASSRLGVPGCQLCRWCKAYELNGFVGLLPKAVGFGPKAAH